ncbi:MAG: preprotein translocase subunit YajC, partial [Sandaracinaceae bacterium]|nr:preprotein translocase subunit YajC [Sandaracinaceae bacterium]
MSDFEQEFLHSVVTLQAPSTAPPSGESEGPDPTAGCVMQAGMIALLFLFMYFLLIRPENKRREEHEKMLNSLRPGQKVR